MKTDNRNNILILGYYDRHNTGDDCFKVIISRMIERLNDQHDDANYVPFFRNPDDISSVYIYNPLLVLVGGGDIVNPYFVDRIKKLLEHFPPQKVALFSVGIPYQSCVTSKYLDFASTIFVRNASDVIFLQSKYQNNIKRIEYFPDLVHSLQNWLPRFRSKSSIYDFSNVGDRPIIGLCLTRTIYQQGYLAEYNNIELKLATVVENLVKIMNAHIVMIPFGINQGNNKENDIVLFDGILNNLNKDVRNHVTYIYPSDEIFDAGDPSVYISYLDEHVFPNLTMAVCARFHAHVLCLNHGIPILSIATTRKVFELLKQWGVSDTCSFSMKVSHLFSPIDFDVDDLLTSVNKILERREEISMKMTLKKQSVMAQLDLFTSKLNAFILNASDSRSAQMHQTSSEVSVSVP